jgi:multidrug efflux system outer membrane protein
VSVKSVCVLVALAVLAGGCTTSDAPPRTGVETPARFLMHRGAPAWPPAGWWRDFRDPELDRVIAEAQAGNPDLVVAVERLAQARARVRVAAAPLAPIVEASATQSAVRQRGFTTEAYGLALDASYELDLFGRNQAGVSAAQSSAEAARFDREVVAITLLAETATSYLELLSVRERIALARRNLVTAERILRVAESRAAEGGGTQGEVAQQRAQVFAQRAVIPGLLQQAFAAQVALAGLIGRPVQAVTVSGPRLPSGRLAAVRPGLPSELLLRRPDIRRAEAELAAAGADVAAARAALLPQIRLTGALSARSALLATLLSNGNLAGAVASSLVQTVFDSGRRAAELDIAETRRIELLSRYRATVHAAFSDVDLALSALQRLSEQESLQRRQLGELQRALSLAEERYRAGADDLLRLLDIQRALTSVEDQLALSRARRLQAHVGLVRALGGGWSEEIARPPEAR